MSKPSQLPSDPMKSWFEDMHMVIDCLQSYERLKEQKQIYDFDLKETDTPGEYNLFIKPKRAVRYINLEIKPPTKFSFQQLMDAL